jgi:hypothetical protein
MVDGLEKDLDKRIVADGLLVKGMNTTIIHSN